MIRTVARAAGPLTLASVAWLLVSGNLVSRHPLVLAGQLAAIALAVWARRTFAAAQFSVVAEPGPGPLLTRGPYRWIRHPMYAAALLLVWAGILGHWSLANAIVGAVVSAAAAARIRVEERLLRERYAGYPAYAARSRCIIPFVL